MSLEAFGVYGIALAVSVFYAGCGNSLLLTQMVVNAPQNVRENRRHIEAIFVLTAMIGVLTVLGGLLLSKVATSFSSYSADVIFSTGLLCATTLGKEYFTRVMFMRRREGQALVINVAVLVSFLLFIAMRREEHIDPELALVLNASACAVGICTGMLLTGVRIRKSSFSPIRAVALSSWSGGKWALLGGAVLWLQSQAHIYLTMLIGGAAGVGVVNAARLLIAPASVFVNGLGQLLLPRLTDRARVSASSAERLSNICSRVLVLGAAVYSAALIAFADIYVRLLLGSSAEVTRALVVSWCAVLIFSAARVSPSTLLQAQRKFREITILTTISAVLAITAGFFLMPSSGLLAGVIGVAIGEFMLWLMIRFRSRRGPAC